MNPIQVSTIIFLCIFGSALLGMWLKGLLPQHHLNDDTKDLMKLGVGLVGTMAALLLGLLVASAKSSYDTRSSELTQMAADVVLLDRALAHYGPATGPIRGILKVGVAGMIDQFWSKNGEEDPLPSHAVGNVIYDKIQELVPRSDGQRML